MTGRGKKAAAAPRKKANGYKMPAPIRNGEVINDIMMKKKWRIGPSIGVGGFGEIYSACDHESSPKQGSGYPFVIKIEPHENGPLFVEKHFYIRNANKDDIAKYIKEKKLSSLGMPTYFGNGSHEYNGEKYRYLVLERYGKDLWSLFKDCGRIFPTTTVFQLGLQMIDVLEYIHSRGYVHADIKGANILLGLKKGTENQAYLVDFGLATRVTDKEFKPDPKCAHNGTIEYTSRDAHLGVATMRGDLEILGYNMLQWLVGELPWEKNLKQPKAVQDMKEAFMKNVRSNITKQYSHVPDALIKFFEYINSMKPKDVPDYTKCRTLFENYLKTEGKTRNSKLEFKAGKKGKVKASADTKVTEDTQDSTVHSKKMAQNGVPKARRGRKPVLKDQPIDSDNCENETPENSIQETKGNKRKSSEPSLVIKIKKTKLTPKATPPVKKKYANTATQTSLEKIRRSPRKVSFDSPICEIIGEKKPPKRTKDTSQESVNSSGDIFEDSFVIEEKKVKPKRKLLAAEEVTVKRVVKKKLTTKPKTKSWKDLPTVVNGRSPPKTV
ncbi:serine/threonine-protein kinase VRK1-like [Hyposmocoma kahamanoa]|uniref:serine/threonine-protein kinase VRK1-like n=1 Tax=Hyposmocoma kahamanoa TaxID=1477025 RepID=UPI000E6D7335|nr:serine/threonine-protein kinase VRK1-like [Hyposmocoma kahamanoa]